MNPVHYKKKIRLGSPPSGMKSFLEACRLNTVCQAARCPNQEECFGQGVATFMILGPACTRNCRFCAVAKGLPVAVDPEEPARIAAAVKEKKYSHAVITSVTRDDLPDGGADHFGAVVKTIRALVPEVSVELLIPDFKGSAEALANALKTPPEVLNHNLETAEILYGTVRPQADYQRSLLVLKRSKGIIPSLVTKSGFMVGLGETPDMVLRLMEDLRSVGCDILTIGQYFQPSRQCLPVKQYLEEGQFQAYQEQGLALGFKYVAAGRFVRSSYRAGEIYRFLLQQSG